MNALNLFQPYYVFRPQQAVIRLFRDLFPRKKGMQEILLPWGMKIRTDIREAVGVSLWNWGVFELEASEILWRLINPGDLVVDAGANIGYMVSIMAKRSGPRGAVLAFEPQPFVYSVLKSNVELFEETSGLATIELYDLALSDRKGQQRMVSFNDNDPLRSWGTSHLSSDGFGDVEVETTTLDEVRLEQDISFLKIDVEGHELKLLQGACRLLEGRKIRHILYENHAAAGDAVHQYLLKCGYSIFYVSWELNGVVLVPLASKAECKPGAPNYLATLDSDGVTAQFKQRGWRCLA